MFMGGWMGNCVAFHNLLPTEVEAEIRFGTCSYHINC